MFKKLAAASALIVLIGGSAMAQTVVDETDHGGRYIVPTERPSVDTMTTGSIYDDNQGSPGAVTTGVAGPCVSDWHSTGPDANASLNVNDRYCGK
ncbi:hypothetical protein [Mesorhizobium sp. SP-1A]|jgi:hypothetical protein|uniref:hypothetical protein n=1 Tax=Mesorhizobium sp. SP-1A TaxID=3077840 RepID=UPI0028F6ECBF|nr:hypothetical protein [Mesorhizobium sp. SP-1A]